MEEEAVESRRMNDGEKFLYNELMREIRKNRRPNKNMNFVPLATSLDRLKREFPQFYTSSDRIEHNKSCQLIKIRNEKIKQLYNKFKVDTGGRTMKDSRQFYKRLRHIYDRKIYN